jgi:hypothetical protein
MPIADVGSLIAGAGLVVYTILVVALPIVLVPLWARAERRGRASEDD